MRAIRSCGCFRLTYILVMATSLLTAALQLVVQILTAWFVFFLLARRNEKIKRDEVLRVEIGKRKLDALIELSSKAIAVNDFVIFSCINITTNDIKQRELLLAERKKLFDTHVREYDTLYAKNAALISDEQNKMLFDFFAHMLVMFMQQQTKLKETADIMEILNSCSSAIEESRSIAEKLRVAIVHFELNSSHNKSKYW